MSRYLNNLSHQAKAYREEILIYCQLSMQPQLSSQDAERLDAILAAAETDTLLSFLLDEADHMVAHLQNFIDDGEITEQQQKLQTCLDDVWLNQALQDLDSRLQTSQCKNLQMVLKEAGFYQGTIDGVMGGATRYAMEAFYQCKGELPYPLPISTPDPINCER
ncbi:MAG: peptidoglycan-binding domain-containing protein [Cyanobacteria bacterium P01_D01_bin.156]